ISLTGLGQESRKKIGELSKGYRQRVGLAQALIHDPEILILDEPTSGLDPNQLVEIRRIIADLGKIKTIILSTHIMQEVEALCNRVIIIDHGKIVADDTPSNLSKNASSRLFIVLSLRNLLQILILNTSPEPIKLKNWRAIFGSSRVKKEKIFVKIFSNSR
ncbi:MAG: ATP-binding cassette domain-containing protein, partial [Bacteroidales bacterium]